MDVFAIMVTALLVYLRVLLKYFIAVSILVSQGSRAEILVPDSANIDVGPHLTYLRDISGLQTITFIKQSNDWLPLPRSYVNFGYSDDVIWLKFSMRVDEPYFGYLTGEYPCTDYFDVFVFKSGSEDPVYQYFSGDRRSFSSRPVASPIFVFPLHFEPDTYDLYVRLQTKGGLQQSLYLQTPDYFAFGFHTTNILILYLGMVLAVLALQFVLYLAFRECIFLAFSAMTGLLALFIVSYYGSLQPLFPDSPDIQHSLIVSSLVASASAAFWFVFELYIDAFSGWRRFLRPIMFGCALLVIVVDLVISYETALTFSYAYFGVITVSSMLWLTTLPKKKKQARSALLAKIGLWSVLGMLLAHLSNELGLPIAADIAVLRHGVLFAGFAQVIILGMVSFRHIFERKREFDQARERVFSVERINSLGRFAQALLREFDEPIRRLIGNLTELRMRNNLQTQDIHKDCQRQLIRMSKLLESLESFANQAEIDNRAWSKLDEIIDDSLNLLRGLFPDVQVRVSVPSDLMIYCSKIHLMHVFLNMFQNAAESLQKLSIGRLKYLEVDVLKNSDGGLQVSIRDNGVGFPDGLDVFAPFVTTKTDSLGLGLTISMDLARKHQIFLTARSVQWCEQSPNVSWACFELNCPREIVCWCEDGCQLIEATG